MISKSCSFSLETEFTPLSLALKIRSLLYKNYLNLHPHPLFLKSAYGPAVLDAYAINGTSHF